MASVTDLFSFSLSHDQDDRVRRNLLPVRSLLTQGSVTGTGFLMEDHPVQASLERGNVCVFKNTDGAEKAAILLDFGRELHGNLKLTAAYIQSSNRRARVLVRFGESAMEALSPVGYKNATNDHAVRDRICDIGQLSTTETNDSGFRFAYIRLEDANAVLEIQAVHAGFLYRDIPYLGSFRCCDPLLEEIWKTAAYTVHLNMQSYLWDGIKRDRLAWQGDMHTEVLTVLHVFGANSVVPKTLDFLRDKTEPRCWVNGYSSYSLWWILVQAEWYRYTGDITYLRQQQAFLKEQAAMAAACVNDQGEEQLPAHRFLDWPNLADDAATHAGLQGIVYLSLAEAAWLLELLEEYDTAALCTAAAERMRGVTPSCGKSKQAGAFLSLSGLADAEDINREVLSPGGAQGYSTFLGYYILAAKAKAGKYREALRDLREYWGGMLRMGATTFWEDFDLRWLENAAPIDEIVPEGKNDIHGDFGAYCYQNFRHSLCHGWSSGPVPFLMRHILGISPAAPGCKKLVLQPHLGDLSWAEGTFPTPLGIVTVRHSANADGSVTTTWSAPEGIEVCVQ